MKKKLLLTFVGTYLASLGLMIAGDDLVKGYDFTGSSSVTAAKLNQLVDNATPGTNRGLVFYSPSAPSASYYRYLWLDPSTTIPGLKVYSTNGGGWSNIIASVSFSQNSIGAGVLQQNAVSTTNIVDNGISTIKIAAGAVTSSKLGLQAVDATNIVNNTITSAQVATNGLATANYADASITAAKLAANSVAVSNLQSGFLLYGSNIASATITGSLIAANTIAATNLATNSITSTYIQSGTLPSGTNISAISLPAVGLASTNAHGLTGAPQMVRIVLRATGTDANTGYESGDELDLMNVVSPGDAHREFSSWTTSTSIVILRSSAGGTFRLFKKSDGILTAVSSTANFQLKIYAVYTP